MDLAAQLVLFAQVADAGGFSAAARELGQTPSSVSKQIGHLEDRLGVRLLNRSTRAVSLTEAGRELYPRCRTISDDVEAASELAESLGTRPQGKLHIVATVAFGKAQLLPVLPRYLAENPDVRIALDLTDDVVDVTHTGVDLAIRFTEQIEDSAVIARKLATNRRIVCAAPSYLAEHGTPTVPGDLHGHNCLRLSTVQHWNAWHFVDDAADDGLAVVQARGNFEANSADAIYHATLAGLGVARLPTYLVAPDIAAGRLVHLLPDHCEPHADIYAVYDSRRHLSPSVRSFIDFLVRMFRNEPPWERTA